MDEQQQKMMDDLRPEQRSTGYAYSINEKRIVVDFWGLRDEGCVMSKVLWPDGSHEGLYVVCFKLGGRMLVGVAGGAEFDCDDPDGIYLNPSGADCIEDSGLDASIFNTYYEGGLFQVVGHYRLDCKANVEPSHPQTLAAPAKMIEGGE